MRGEEKQGIFETETNSYMDTERNRGEFHVATEEWTLSDTKKTYHQQRLEQSKWAFYLSFWGSTGGFVVILISVISGMFFRNPQWAGIVSGTIIEAVSALFYNLSNRANQKISEFFDGLTEDANVERAIHLSNEIEDQHIRDELKVKLALYLSGIDEEKICKNTNEVCEKNGKK